MKVLEKTSNLIVKIFSLAILVFLAGNSILTTQRYGREEWGEILNGAPIYKVSDGIWVHLLCVALMVVLVLLLRKLQISDKCVKIIQAVLAVTGGVFALVMFLDGARPPADDQVQVYSAAMLFNEGDFRNLMPGGYVEMYPQQLGYILYMQLMFRLFGTTSYSLLQVVNCLFIVGILWMMSLVINEVVDNRGIRLLASVFMALQLPIYFLHTWVYGDVPFLFFAMVFFWCYLKLGKAVKPRAIQGGTKEADGQDVKEPGNKGKTIAWIVVFFLLSACLMVLFRKNALIILIAAFLLLLLEGIFQKKRLCLLLAVGVLAVPLMTSHAVNKGYSLASGYGPLRGLPSTCWIAMGMIEGESKPGWFNNFGVPTYYENDCDYDATSAKSVEMIQYKLNEFTADPVMAVSFYKRKISTQWNDPFYNTVDLVGADSQQVRGISGWMEKHTDFLQGFLDEIQLLIYMGGVLYVLLSKKSLLQRLPEVILIGGFLFSVLWEGNSRYVYPYVLLILPMAVMGWQMVVEKVAQWITQSRREEIAD